jgi:hypothetical protein
MAPICKPPPAFGANLKVQREIRDRRYSTCPAARSCTGNSRLKIAASYQAMTDAGGDIYDFVPLDETPSHSATMTPLGHSHRRRFRPWIAAAVVWPCQFDFTRSHNRRLAGPGLTHEQSSVGKADQPDPSPPSFLPFTIPPRGGSPTPALARRRRCSCHPRNVRA